MCSENSAAFCWALSGLKHFSTVVGPVDDVETSLVSLSPVVGSQHVSIFCSVGVHPCGSGIEKWYPRVGGGGGIRMEAFELVVGVHCFL